MFSLRERLVLLVLFALLFSAGGCLNSGSAPEDRVKERQSGYASEEKENRSGNVPGEKESLNEHRGYVSEDQALEVVCRSGDVARWLTRIKSTPRFMVEERPTKDSPYYVIRVAEDMGDHLVTFDFFTVDAYSGKITHRELQDPAAEETGSRIQ